jgi:hypothetical protein
LASGQWEWAGNVFGLSTESLKRLVDLTRSEAALSSCSRTVLSTALVVAVLRVEYPVQVHAELDLLVQKALRWLEQNIPATPATVEHLIALAAKCVG